MTTESTFEPSDEELAEHQAMREEQLRWVHLAISAQLQLAARLGFIVRVDPYVTPQEPSAYKARLEIWGSTRC